MNPFFQRGWIRFPSDPQILKWVNAAAPAAQATFQDPTLRAQWLRCGGTWFAGVNALPNDTNGAIPAAGVPPLSGGVIDYISTALGLNDVVWDRAQVSICLPGYPQPWDGETDAAFRFRRDRDAAHLDGLLRDENRRRRPREQHGFILGLPLTDAAPDAAPFVVYEGSHHVMRQALSQRLADVPPEQWADEDVTDAYTAARRKVFETCKRVKIHARPGEAYLAHRLVIHGVAPWTAGPEGQRTIAYFRPDPHPDQPPEWWLQAP